MTHKNSLHSIWHPWMLRKIKGRSRVEKRKKKIQEKMEQKIWGIVIINGKGKTLLEGLDWCFGEPWETAYFGRAQTIYLSSGPICCILWLLRRAVLSLFHSGSLMSAVPLLFSSMGPLVLVQPLLFMWFPDLQFLWCPWLRYLLHFLPAGKVGI